MRIFVVGQKSFGAAVFQMLRRSHEIVAVAAPKMARDGSGDRLYGYAKACGFSPIDAANLRAECVPKTTDLIVCAHSHTYIGRKTRSAARLGAIGYHPSLLPRHRGRDAVRWAIRMNDPLTGGSVYWLDNSVDGGPIAAQEWCWIAPGTDASTLWRKQLFPLGLVLINRVVSDLVEGKIVRLPQNEAVATFEPAIDPPRLYRPELEQISDGRDTLKYQVESDLQREMRTVGF
jgi:methionyl-tRNA formyltransferase